MNSALKKLWARSPQIENVALLLILVGVCVLFAYILITAQSNANLAAQISSLENAAAKTDPSARQTADIDRFVTALPNNRQRSKDLVEISRLARMNGLRLDQLQFDELAAAAEDNRLKALTGRMTITGTYGSIRRWLHDVLVAMPGIAVSSLRLGASGEDRLLKQLRIEFVYYSNPTSPDRPAPPSDKATPVIVGPILDPFRAELTMRPLPAPTVKPAELPAPPYSYGGSVRSGDGEFFLLIEDGNEFRIRVGETLPGGNYRLERADRQQLELIHLPTNRRLSLPTGSTAP